MTYKSVMSLSYEIHIFVTLFIFPFSFDVCLNSKDLDILCTFLLVYSVFINNIFKIST